MKSWLCTHGCSALPSVELACARPSFTRGCCQRQFCFILGSEHTIGICLLLTWISVVRRARPEACRPASLRGHAHP